MNEPMKKAPITRGEALEKVEALLDEVEELADEHGIPMGAVMQKSSRAVKVWWIDSRHAHPAAAVVIGAVRAAGNEGRDLDSQHARALTARVDADLARSAPVDEGELLIGTPGPGA